MRLPQKHKQAGLLDICGGKCFFRVPFPNWHLFAGRRDIYREKCVQRLRLVDGNGPAEPRYQDFKRCIFGLYRSGEGHTSVGSDGYWRLGFRGVRCLENSYNPGWRENDWETRLLGLRLPEGALFSGECDGTGGRRFG